MPASARCHTSPTRPSTSPPPRTSTDIRGTTTTADTLHTVTAHTRYPHERDASSLIPVNNNPPAHFATLDTLDWDTTSTTTHSQDTNNGRHAIRTARIHPLEPTQAPLTEQYTTARPRRREDTRDRRTRRHHRPGRHRGRPHPRTVRQEPMSHRIPALHPECHPRRERQPGPHRQPAPRPGDLAASPTPPDGPTTPPPTTTTTPPTPHENPVSPRQHASRLEGGWRSEDI